MRKWITFEINQDYLSSSAFRFLDGQSTETMKRVLDALNKSDANYFINKAACALHPIKKAKSMAEPEGQGELFAFGATVCLLYTSPSPRDRTRSRMPSSA